MCLQVFFCEMQRFANVRLKHSEFRHSAFSHVLSAVQPFEVKEGMEGEHTPESDFIRCHQDLEEGDRFESSDLGLERCCFLALLRVDTHVF